VLRGEPDGKWHIQSVHGATAGIAKVDVSDLSWYAIAVCTPGDAGVFGFGIGDCPVDYDLFVNYGTDHNNEVPRDSLGRALPITPDITTPIDTELEISFGGPPTFPNPVDLLLTAPTPNGTGHSTVYSATVNSPTANVVRLHFDPTQIGGAGNPNGVVLRSRASASYCWNGFIIGRGPNQTVCWSYDTDIAFRFRDVDPKPPAPVITQQPTDVAAFNGHPATFNIVATLTPTAVSSTYLTINWQRLNATTGAWQAFNSNVASDQSTLTFTADAAKDNNAKFRAYVCETRLSDSETCITSDEVTLNVSTLDVVTFWSAQPADISAAAGTTASFTVTASGQPAPVVVMHSRTQSGVQNDLQCPVSHLSLISTTCTLTTAPLSMADNLTDVWAEAWNDAARTIVTSRHATLTVTSNGTSSSSSSASSASPSSSSSASSTSSSSSSVSSSSSSSSTSSSSSGGQVCTGSTGSSAWCWEHPYLQGNELYGAAYGLDSSTDALAVGAKGTILRSTDGGRTWTIAPIADANNNLGSEDLFSVAYAGPNANAGKNPTNNTAFAVGVDVSLQSDDGGAHWTNLYLQDRVNPSLLNCCVKFIGVAFGDATHGIIVSNKGVVFRTANAGVSWALTDLQLDAHDLSVDVNAISMNGTNAILGTNNGTVFFSNDGGATWNRGTSGTSSRILDVSMASPTVAIMTTVYNNGVVSNEVPRRSTDGGNTWSPIATNLALQAIALMGSGNGYASDGSNYFFTNDDGVTWRLLPTTKTFNPTTGLQADKLIVSPLMSLQAIVLGRNGAAGMLSQPMFTQDGFTTLQNHNSPPAELNNLFAVAKNPVTGTVLAVGENRTVLRRDGATYNGTKWGVSTDPAQFSALPNTGLFTAVTYNATGSAVLLASSCNIGVYFNTHIYRSTDDGLSWSDVGAIPNGPVALCGVAFSPALPSLGIAVGFVGNGSTSNILRTTDGGVTWQPVQGTNTALDLRGVQFLDASNVVAVGADRSTGGPIVYRSIDGGATWALAALSGLTTDGGLTSVSFANNTTGIAGGFANGLSVIAQTTDGGATWTLAAPINSNPGTASVGCALNGVCLATGGYGYLRSTDFGATWLFQSNNYMLTTSAVLAIDANTFMSVGGGGAVFINSKAGAAN